MAGHPQTTDPDRVPRKNGVRGPKTLPGRKEGPALRQYAIGKTLYVEVRSTEKVELERSGWNVVVTGSGRLIPALRRAMPGTPVVMAGADVDPVAMGVAAASAALSRNVTGTTLVAAELNQEQLKLLRLAVPSIRRVAIVVNPDNPAHAAWSDVLTQDALDIAVTRIEARTDTDLDKAFASATRDAAEALIVLPDPEYRRFRASIASQARRHGLPTIAGDVGFADAGGLFAYHPALVDSWREAAVFVDRILKGAAPGSLAIRTVTQREFVVNVGVAKALGIELSPRVTLKATRVIP